MWDFVKLTRNPLSSSSFLMKFEIDKASIQELAPPKISSKKANILMARLLQYLIKLLITFVKTNGAVLNPKSKTLNKGILLSRLLPIQTPDISGVAQKYQCDGIFALCRI